ncbi:hypothetical protein EJ06DRAFT_397833 [Trichodelitschia bisporula]|uniref:Uncharacterized protein n=1 Tax=Trichodelitschia bisporula TaxID=703511 RepID=A0A6G1HXY4_9PEZI|nr:hypothetical protein EJ06DRAFT_397833 [Trichodelitschia bisporula]
MAPRLYVFRFQQLYQLIPLQSTGKSSGGMMGGMGGDSTLAGQSYFLNIKKGFCNENAPCTVYAGKVGVQFEDGTKADPSKGVYIHHVLTTDTTKKTESWLSSCDNPTRPGSSVSSMGSGTGFVGTGEDSGDVPVLYTSRDGKANAGYHVGQGDAFMAMVELVNYNKEAKQVYITYDLEWTPRGQEVNSKGMLISISQCKGKAIKTSNAGPTNTTSGKWTVREDGNILAARGHLHDGGVAVDLFINNKFACASKAVYGGAGSTAEINGQQWQTISSMTNCDGPVPVKKGDELSMVVEYDLKKYPL